MLRLFLRALASLACLLALAGLSGCGRTRADLVILNGAEPETLDPHLMTGQLEQRIAYALYEGLTAYNAKAEVQPGVAERWEVSPDGRTYTFHLRRDARWSDGSPVTAHDFVASWRRCLEPATAAEYAYQLHYIRGAAAFNEGKTKDFASVGVSAPDDWTLRVELEIPTPFFPGLCATSPAMPVHVSTRAAADGTWMRPGRMVTNGAFVLEAWRLNDRVRLRRNEQYWNRAAVRVATLDLLPVSRPNTALNLYAAGQADVMMDKFLTPASLLGELRRRPDFHAAPFLGTMFIRFNTTRRPFNDPRVRLAFSLAVDRTILCEKITRAGEVPAFSMVPPGAGGYDPPRPGSTFDPEQARRLFAAAGFPGGRGFPPVDYLYNEGELYAAVAVELQAMFQRELGVNIGLRPMENKVYLRAMSGLDYDLARSSWIGDYDDPNTFLDLFTTSSGNNRTGWKDPRYDALIGRAAAEVDPAQRRELFVEAERLLVSEAAPVAPLHYFVGIQMFDPKKIGGLESNLLDEHPLREIYRK